MREGIIAIIGSCLVFGILGGSAMAIYETDRAREIPKYFLAGFVIAVLVVLSLVAVLIGIWLMAFGVWTVVTN